MINKLIQPELFLLEIRLNQARKKLQKVWDAQGVTNEVVLDANREFDALLNRYMRIQKERSFNDQVHE